MTPDRTDFSSSAIESRIRELVERNRILIFTALAATLHDCRWINLFRALNYLEKQQVVRLIPLPWDYQICRVPNATQRMEKA